MSKKTASSMYEQIPWVVSGACTADEKKLLEIESASKPEWVVYADHVQRLRAGIVTQPQMQPPPEVEDRLLAAIHTRPSVNMHFTPVWLQGLLVSLGLFILLWLVIRPGVVLRWSLPTNGVEAFRIYRAPQGEAEYSQIGEILAKPGVNAYSYVDPYLLPGSTYQYTIEGVKTGGEIVPSTWVVGRGMEILPGQMILLAASALLGYMVVWLVQQGNGNIHFPLQKFKLHFS